MTALRLAFFRGRPPSLPFSRAAAAFFPPFFSPRHAGQKVISGIRCLSQVVLIFAPFEIPVGFSVRFNLIQDYLINVNACSVILFRDGACSGIIPNVDRATVGAKLKALRERFYVKPADLASDCGVNPPQIISAESGTSYMRIDLLEKVLKKCGSSLSQFFAELERDERGETTDSIEFMAQNFKVLASRDPEGAEAPLQIISRLAKRKKSSKKH